MAYFEYNIRLTNGQKQKLVSSYKKKSPITLRLNHTQLSGSDKVFLTKRQVNKIERSNRNGTGTDIKISSTQVRKQTGGFLGRLLSKVGTMVRPWLSKVVGPLATGALSGLSSFGVNKILGNGLFSVLQEIKSTSS